MQRFLRYSISRSCINIHPGCKGIYSAQAEYYTNLLTKTLFSLDRRLFLSNAESLKCLAATRNQNLTALRINKCFVADW